MGVTSQLQLLNTTRSSFMDGWLFLLFLLFINYCTQHLRTWSMNNTDTWHSIVGHLLFWIAAVIWSTVNTYYIHLFLSQKLLIRKYSQFKNFFFSISNLLRRHTLTVYQFMKNCHQKIGTKFWWFIWKPQQGLWRHKKQNKI